MLAQKTFVVEKVEKPTLLLFGGHGYVQSGER